MLLVDGFYFVSNNDLPVWFTELPLDPKILNNAFASRIHTKKSFCNNGLSVVDFPWYVDDDNVAENLPSGRYMLEFIR